jgi:hypothetical protein
VSIYVEILIRAPMEELWRRTQDPALHELWDLRFTRIEHLPRASEDSPQRFRYSTRAGFGIGIDGEGESAGSRDGAGSERTSALRFWSDDPISLIREGSGYWRYVPTEDGIRFLTWYDYRTRWGSVGRVLDGVLFRPLMGWATAWSFDRLRLWLECGLEPRGSLERALVHTVARLTVALIFVYHGLVPKLLAHHPDEMAMLTAAGVADGARQLVLLLIGGAEIAWGLVIALRRSVRWPLVVTAALMPLLLLSVAATAPRYLAAAFNPVSLDLSVMALSVIAWLTARDLPSSAHCLRRKPAGAA